MKKNILILTGGPVKKLEAFVKPADELGLNVTLASFYDLEFENKKDSNEFKLTVQGKDLVNFDLIYIRMVGKRLEDATMVVNYAKDKKIKIVDKAYEDSLFIPSTISKAMEMKKLIEAGIPLPETYFGSLYLIKEKVAKILGFPFVLKSTSGKKARDAWLVDDNETLDFLVSQLREREKMGDRFFGQKLIKATQRIRALVVGEKVIGAITRPTKWRKSYTKGTVADVEAKKGALIPVAQKYSDIAIKASNAADLDVSGIDILEEDKTGKLYVIEANAAPSWNLIKKDCGIDVEKEILKYITPGVW